MWRGPESFSELIYPLNILTILYDKLMLAYNHFFLSYNMYFYELIRNRIKVKKPKVSTWLQQEKNVAIPRIHFQQS